MKLLALILIAFPALIFADPRINVRNDTCHVLLDHLNPNIQANIPACGGVVVENAGVAAGYAEKQGIIHVTTLPLSIQPVDPDPVVISINWRDLPRTTCKLIDANNQQYLSGRWWSRVVLKRLVRTLPNGTEILTPRVKWSARLRCIDGAIPPRPAP